jgi:hypothetical protein
MKKDTMSCEQTSAPVAPTAVARVELVGRTGIERSTTVTVTEPTLLQPIREVFNTTSGVGELRIGVESAGAPSPPGITKLYPSAWQNGDVWLPYAGDWDITFDSEAEDRVSIIDFALPYLMLPSPDACVLEAAMHGLGAGRAVYHAETVTEVWDQIMKLEQRMIVRQHMTLSVRGGDLRYRWAGPPGVPEGLAWDLLKDGDTVPLRHAPLASLWVRADVEPDPLGPPVLINFVSARLR